MDTLYAIVRALDPQERRIALRYLKTIAKQPDAPMVKLFQWLCKQNGEPDYNKISKRLYGKEKNTSAFKVLKARLKERLLEFWAISARYDDLALIRRKYKPYEPVARVLIAATLRKQAIYAEFLTLKGFRDVAIEYWKRNLKIAKEYALSAYELEALTKLFALYVEKGEKKSLEDLQKQIFYALEKYKTDLQAYHYYETYKLYYYNKAQREAGKQYLENCLRSLQEALQRTPDAAIAQFNYYLMQCLLYLIHPNNPETTLQATEELLAFIEKYPTVMTKNRLALAYHTLMQAYLVLCKPQKALPLIEKLHPLLNKKRANYLLSLLTRCWIYHWNALNDEAITAATAALKHPLINNHPKEQGVAYLVLSVQYWLKNDLKSAYNYYLKTNALQEDKKGWNLYTRAYELMLLVEKNFFDLFMSRLEAFRKYLESHIKPGNRFHERIEHFYKVLLQLEKHSLDWKILKLILENSLKWFEAHPPAKGLMTLELLPYEVWIYAKCYNTSLKEAFEKYREKFS